MRWLPAVATWQRATITGTTAQRRWGPEPGGRRCAKRGHVLTTSTDDRPGDETAGRAGVGGRGRAGDAPRTDRRITAHRGLPTSRAVVGGLLVALACIGVFLLARPDPDAGLSPYVVAAGPIEAGHRIESTDLASVLLRLSDPLTQQAYVSPDAVVGTVALTPLEAGDLVQRSAVSNRGGTTTDVPVRELTFPVPRDRAPAQLSAGEWVTILATVTSGADSVTTITAANARVVRFATDDSSLGSNRTAVLTIALDVGDDMASIVHDTQVADLTVVRSTGTGASRNEARPIEADE